MVLPPPGSLPDLSGSLVSPASELPVHGPYMCTNSFALLIYTSDCDKIFTWICYVSQDYSFPEARAISNSIPFIQWLALTKLSGNSGWIKKIIQDPTLESSFTLGFEPRFPSQLTQSFQLSSIGLLNQIVHVGLQLEGKWGEKSMELLRRSPGACPMSSTANWMSHFIFSKNRDFSSQMQNSCCTSQVVARIQYSSTHTTKLAGRLKHKKTTLCFCEYYFFFSTYSHHYFSLFFPTMSDLFTVLLFTLA